MSAYHDLESRFRRRALLGEAMAILHWDNATTMPPGAAEGRAEQITALTLESQAILTDPDVVGLLDDAEAAADAADPWRAANLGRMRRAWQHANAVPPDLVAALTRAGSACEMVWREARQANDFQRLRPYLEKVVELTRESSAARADALDCSPYDALLDQYEPGGNAARIDALFADLESFLPDFLGKVLDAQAGRPEPIMPDGPFPVDAQRDLGERLMRALGFDFDQGRLDVSHHPFTGGVVDDVRITTRYSEDDFTQSLMGTLHETGHALYEMGLPRDWRYQPVGEAGGMALHESQSLLIEMQVCRGPHFLDYAAPLMRQAFGGSGPAWETDNLARLYAKVARGLIRVDADEVTYPLHVMLRYRLEQAILSGDLSVKDLPGAWNDAMAELVGIRPPDDRDGCMQDIHWMDGAFGYFPTYTLGALAAAQLFDAATAQAPDILPGISRGDFGPLLGWLRDHVHSHGRRFDTNALLTEATGKPLDTGAFKAHLQARYFD